MPTRPRLVGLFSAALLLAAAQAQSVVGPVRYGRDVRPILADRCFRCHGPDAASRSAELRLDERDAALARREHGAAIVPGAPEQSLLVQRISAHDDDRMPPPDSGKPALTEAERALIQRWIGEGAEYEAHWSFLPPQRPQLPAGEAPHPVDRFLQHTLAQHGLGMSPAADAATLARRAFLVVTGLPPTDQIGRAHV